MKRVALLCLGLALGAANAAEAQLTMQMSNGWSFTFAGNVNAFIIYQQNKGCTGDTCVTARKDNSFGTGLLPAFAVFDAKGKEDNLDNSGARWATAKEADKDGVGEVIQSLRSLAYYHRDVYRFHTHYLNCSEHTYESKPSGWLLLNRVSASWELWRRLNGFPVVTADSAEPGKKSGKVKLPK